MILVSGPTIGLPSVERFELAIQAFRDLDCRVVLAIGDRLHPSLLPVLPNNFEINRFSAHLDMLKSASLFVCHAGQISTLEALYRGVPLLALPLPHPLYESIADRISELGLGMSLRQPDASVENVAACAASLLDDEVTLGRVRQVQSHMTELNNPSYVVDLISDYLARQT